MFGFSLLGISLFLYIIRQHKLSFFVFVTFMLNGWCVLTDTILGYKNYDLAFIYIISVLIINIFLDKRKIRYIDMTIITLIVLFIVFLFFVIRFSYNHYKFTPYQILQGSRASFLILCYFFLRRMEKETFIWLNKAFFYITLVTSILFILEVFYNLPLFPYTMIVKVDDFTGIMRYYNSPPLLYWYLIVTILYPSILNSRLTTIGSFVFSVALIATLGRTQIGMTFGVVLLGLLLKGKANTLLKVLIISGILSVPFMEILNLRFEGKYGNDTESEVKSIFSGGIADMANGDYTDEGTLTYRFAWIYERMLYLSNRPFGESVFGLGLISDSQTETVQAMYHFNLGLYNEDGFKQQMTTPDISYGNLLSKYGYVGGFLYLFVWFYLLGFFFIHRKHLDYAFVGFLLVLDLMLISIAGTSVSDQGNLIFPFMIFIYVNNTIKGVWKDEEGNEEEKAAMVYSNSQ